MSKLISIRVPDELYESAHDTAQKNGKTVSDFVRDLIAVSSGKYLPKNHEKNAAQDDILLQKIDEKIDDVAQRFEVALHRFGEIIFEAVPEEILKKINEQKKAEK